MSVYLWIDLLTLLGPLALSFDRRVRFWRSWGALFPSILVAGGLHAVWDALVAARGDWGFNPAYVLPVRLFGLPLEELLFFVAVPYACVFVYEAGRVLLRERSVAFPRFLSFAIAGVAAATAFVFRGQHYTFLVCLAFGGFFLLAGIAAPGLLRTSSFWIGQLLGYLPFLVVNGILTALPVVTYDRGAIWGVRAYTIPLEDFLYSFTLVGLSILFYHLFRSLASDRRKAA